MAIRTQGRKLYCWLTGPLMRVHWHLRSSSKDLKINSIRLATSRIGRALKYKQDADEEPVFLYPVSAHRLLDEPRELRLPPKHAMLNFQSKRGGFKEVHSRCLCDVEWWGAMGWGHQVANQRWLCAPALRRTIKPPNNIPNHALMAAAKNPPNRLR